MSSGITLRFTFAYPVGALYGLTVYAPFVPSALRALASEPERPIEHIVQDRRS